MLIAGITCVIRNTSGGLEEDALESKGPHAMNTFRQLAITVPDNWAELLNKIQQLLDQTVPECHDPGAPASSHEALDASANAEQFLPGRLEASLALLEEAVRRAEHTAADADAGLEEMATGLNTWLGRCRVTVQRLAEDLAKPL